MPTQLELQSDTMVFNITMTHDLDDADRSLRGSWRSETRLEMLAHEIVRYTPDLAELLKDLGMQKMAA
ncbi:hypothetical protein [Brevifollis gellanilyticus]|uniref:Uncharacterized protein n=1 Tax=Brevifollis gellanilyticus TaxID=748831 RepID=A0A512MD94_9BACT|nr:hypothetical protein [Brevifollis gellanilyticus]GEP44703.1 hypothetical protein BGE01nite_39940 [Brevifollis gellanilyticus]